MKDFRMNENKLNELIEALDTETSYNGFDSIYPKPNCKLLGVGKTKCTVRNLVTGKLVQVPTYIMWNTLFY